ncbi:MAG: phosphoglycerate dehydrogenase, partial [Planctomycetes bacterium]|nr:phosphoglycerate dehydrogenase [Planctomycetota bacterium]
LTKEPGVEFVINPKGRKLKESELPKIIKDCDIIIAGTEKYSREVLASADRLKLISRVGIGLDSIDLQAARDLGIIVSYTPDAPSPAVAELTIGLMFSLLRQIPLIDRKLRSGIWQRISGERLSNMVIGIIGTGRVGSRILKHLQGFHPKRIFVNDIHPDHNLYEMYHAELVEKETIYEKADIITLHVPLTPLTQGLIGKKELDTMKPNTRLINTSRGGIIDENALYNALIDKRIAGAAIDVYENEPYTGNLIELRNNVLTCHMGSMTKDCRKNMEIQAAEEAIRFIRSEPLKNIVPESEYHIGNESYRSNKSVHAANSCGKRTAPLHEMT